MVKYLKSRRHNFFKALEAQVHPPPSSSTPSLPLLLCFTHCLVLSFWLSGSKFTMKSVWDAQNPPFSWWGPQLGRGSQHIPSPPSARSLSKNIYLSFCYKDAYFCINVIVCCALLCACSCCPGSGPAGGCREGKRAAMCGRYRVVFSDLCWLVLNKCLLLLMFVKMRRKI